MKDIDIRKAFDTDYWSSYYPICQDCKLKCKQSHKLLDLYCPQYEKKGVRSRK